MRRQVSWFAGALVAAGVMLASVRPMPAAESALAGNWKVIVLSQGQEINVWLIQLEVKNGKATATFLSAGLPNFKATKIVKTTLEGSALHLTLNALARNIEVTAVVPKGEKTPKTLHGTVKLGPQSDFLRLERTEDKELDADPKKSIKAGPAFKDYQTALRATGEEKIKALTELQDKYPNDPLAITAGTQLLTTMLNKGAKDAEIQSQADRILKTAVLYGPDMAQEKRAAVLALLLRSKKHGNLALTYARQAEKSLPESAPAAQRLAVLKNLVLALHQAGKKDEARKIEEVVIKLALEDARQAEQALPKSAPGAQRVAVLKKLALALKQAGKKDEAKKIEEEVVKLDDDLDKEFLKTAIPFAPEPFTGRKEKSNRVVVVELFTGAQCPPCVAADIAFDASLKTYKPKDVVLLQYHLHIPGPDALTNTDTEARARYFKSDIRGTPTVLIDGKQGPGLGGYKQHSKGSYDRLREAIDKKLEEKPGAELKLTAQRQADKIEMTGDVSGLEKPGQDMRLRFVLLEDVARYAGRNGQRLHHHVVRALPGGPKGFALTQKADKKTVTLDLKDLASSLNHYLDEKSFDEGDRPLPLKHFKAVAFIQDDKTKEILQAVQVNVPAEVR